MAYEGRLAHSVTATQHQHPAETPPDALQKLAKGITLAAVVQQRPLRALPRARYRNPGARCRSLIVEAGTRRPAHVAGHPLPPASHDNQPARDGPHMPPKNCPAYDSAFRGEAQAGW